MRRRHVFLTITITLVLATAGLTTIAKQGAPPPRRPGALGGGITQLPNGWRIAPAGRHAPIGDLPLNMVWSPDGRYLLITNNGWSKPSITVFDTANFNIKGVLPLDHAWLGLAWHPDGKRLFSSGAAQNVVNELGWNGETLKAGEPIVIAKPVLKPTFETLKDSGFVGGVSISPDGSKLYAVQVFGSAVSMIDLERRKVERTAHLSAEPYSSLVSADGRSVFVSLWGGAKVLVLDAATLELKAEMHVGEHPNAMVQSKDGARLFVACANTNAVWVVDLKAQRATEQIGVALFPNAPPGSTPNALALSPDGATLLVANADNNTVAVVDVSKPGESHVARLHPDRLVSDRRHLRPRRPSDLRPERQGPVAVGEPARTRSPACAARTASTSAPCFRARSRRSRCRTTTELADDDEARLRGHALRRRDRLAPADAPSTRRFPAASARRRRSSTSSTSSARTAPTIRSSATSPPATAIRRSRSSARRSRRTRTRSRRSSSCSTTSTWTPRSATTATRSRPGAYATDFVEKIWPTNYGQRGGIYLSEGGGGQRNPYGNLSAPPHGYIWDFATRANVTVRSYGEFVDKDEKTGVVEASVPGLQGHFSPDYPPFDLNIPDNKRVDAWLREFREFEQNGQLPQLTIIRLGNDHTAATRPGARTPRAMIAENDLALGRLVEAISHSRYWKESAIFVLEDDAQNGPDHVDAHRSPALVISPFTKRRAVDSTLYTTSRCCARWS